MATIGVKAQEDRVVIWINGPRGGHQEFSADITRDHSFKVMLEQAIREAEDERERQTR